MTNHVHLLGMPDHLDGLSRLMQSLGRRYVQYVNRIYKRTGTFWEGRFKSSVVREADFFDVLPVYRTQSSPRRHGCRSRPIPLVKLPA